MLDRYANLLIDRPVYHQRSKNESVNFSVKRRYGEELVSRGGGIRRRRCMR